MASGKAATVRVPVINTAATVTVVRREAEDAAALVLQTSQRENEVAAAHAPPAAWQATEDPDGARGAMPTPETAEADSVQRDPSGPTGTAFDQGTAGERVATIGCMQLMIENGPSVDPEETDNA